MVLKRQTLVVLATLIPALTLLVFSASVHSQPTGDVLDEDPSGIPYASGELIVSYEEGAVAASSSGRTIEAVNDVLSSVGGSEGASVETDIPILDAKVVEFPEVKGDASGDSRESSLEEIKEELEESPGVEGVYYNYARTGSAAANDRLFRRQYGLKRANFPAAWKRHKRGARVAVVDSGVANHPDLRRKVVARYDFQNNNATVEDLNGHGTHIAGIVGARTNNRAGVAGGCPKCTIVAAKALDKNLSGFDSNIAQAINWSVNRGAKVVNLSLGGLGEKSILKEAIDNANRRGAVVVAAGGNYGDGRPVYPAAYANVLSVAYTDSRDRRSPNSSFGAWQNVAAPGVNIVSTVPGGYGTKTGSSFSAPHASALAGILAGQKRPKAVVFRRIQVTATDVGPRGKDPYYGHGRINAARASQR